MSFRERLRDALAQENMSQAELARRVGVKPQTVSLWMAGEIKPIPERIEMIADIVSLPRGELLNEAGFRSPEERAAKYASIEEAIRGDDSVSAESKRALLHFLKLARLDAGLVERETRAGEPEPHPAP